MKDLKSSFFHGETTIQNKILLDEDLTAVEKILYLTIKMLSYKDGYCWATNNELASILNSTENAIKLALHRLKQKKYIISNVNRKRVPMRKIFTVQAWAELTYLGKLPEDCQDYKVPIEDILPDPVYNYKFKDFKELLIVYYKNIQFYLTDGKEIGYRRDVAFKINDTGHIINLYAQSVLNPQEAWKIWEYLYKRKKETLLYFKQEFLKNFDEASKSKK